MKRWLWYLTMGLLVLALPACAGGVDTIEVNEAGWEIQALGIPVAEVYEIVALDDRQMPTYNDCADGAGQPRPPSQCALDLIFVASPDYQGADEAQYTNHVQDIILNVFDVPNSINRHAGFGQLLRPFRFYATEYRYPSTTPAGDGKCSPGLPEGWVPASDNVDPEAPSWDCNLALSTAGVELNVGFVMHMEPLYDRSRYNLFTAEYNSYAAILHELSHATFIISDEGPFAPSETGLRWVLKEFANIFVVGSEEAWAACEQACAASQGHCVDIYFLDRDGELTDERSGFARCEAVDGESTTNLMYFYPQPAPGENEAWTNFDFYHGAVGRTQYIYDKCRQAGC